MLSYSIIYETCLILSFWAIYIENENFTQNISNLESIRRCIIYLMVIITVPLSFENIRECYNIYKAGYIIFCPIDFLKTEHKVLLPVFCLIGHCDEHISKRANVSLRICMCLSYVAFFCCSLYGKYKVYNPKFPFI